MSPAMPLHIAALGWLPTHGRRTSVQLALPTDLFLLTVHRGRDRLASGAGTAGLELTLTGLRTRAERFRSRVPGELAYALLTPAGVLALLRAPLEGLTDRRMPLDRICSPQEIRALRDALVDEDEPAARVRLFAGWIERRIRQRHGFGMQQGRVAEAALRIQHAGGPLPLAGLRRELHVSQRQLERDFRTWLGVSPATYSRIVRFQRAAMSLAAGAGLCETAAGEDYADQSHLNRAFRQLSTLTPREFARLAGGADPSARRDLAGRVVVVPAPPAH